MTNKVLIVTRHEATIEYIKRCFDFDEGIIEVVPHLTDEIIESINEPTLVVGVRPIALAAELCSRGAKVMILTFQAPQELRGKELGFDDLKRFEAKLVEYRVTTESELLPKC